MERSANILGPTLFWTVALLSGGALGCTTMTVPHLPDAGPEPDAQVDAAASDARTLPPPVIDTCTPEGMGATLGQSCAGDPACDDGCYCNGVEVCQGGVCVAAASDPCVDTVECTADSCLEEADRCFHDPRHEMCTDGDACNGTELCDLANGCVPGTPPYCNDETSCTLDSCDPSMGCVFTARDLDADGYTDGHCGGEDCDDDPRYGGVDIHPGATEDCMNRRDDDCDGMRDYNDHECLPTNDTCEAAVVLPGPGTYSGSTAGLASSYSLSCRTSGPDAVFKFTLTEAQDVTVTISGGGGGVGVALRPWAQCATGPDEKCSVSSPPTFLRRSLPAGEWAIIVQSSSGAAFDLNMRYGPPTEVPPVDVCDAGTQDLCDPGHAACDTSGGPIDTNVTGMFAEVSDDYTPGCGSSGYRDAAYQFTLDAPKDVTLTASSGSSGYTYLVLTRDCADGGAQLRCNEGTWGGTSELRQRGLEAGTYFVYLESDNASASMWNLHATITDPAPRNPGDGCSSAIDISESTEGGGGSGSVALSSVELDSGTTCGGTESWFLDANFVFTLGSMRDVTLTMNDTTTWSTYFTMLQSGECGPPASSLRCWSGTSTLVQSWRSLPAGTYYVTTSSGESSGTISASIVTRPPTAIPPNDRCGGAIPLTTGTRRTDTTSGFEDDAPGGSCASGSMPDAFYSITLAERSHVTISVSDADTSDTRFYLTLRSACGSGTEIACSSGGTSSGGASINEDLDPGTYYLQVETSSTDVSDYDIFAFVFPS